MSLIVVASAGGSPGVTTVDFGVGVDLAAAGAAGRGRPDRRVRRFWRGTCAVC